MNYKTQLFQLTATVQIPRLLIEYTNNKSPYHKQKKACIVKPFTLNLWLKAPFLTTRT